MTQTSALEIVPRELADLQQKPQVAALRGDPRAGPLEALKLMPDDKTVVLGLVTTKSPVLEDAEMLRARVKQASAYVSMDRLCISPQCGFSGNVGNTVMTADEQFAKLRLVVGTAQSLWGDA